jgi:O-antigen/teichoic acid export membrane protein
MTSSTGDVGSYAVLYQLGYYPISLLTGMAMQFLVPILYQRAGDAKDSKRNAGVNQLSWKMTWLSLGLTAVTFLVAILVHTQLFLILVAEEYRAVSYLMPWIILSGGIFASGQTLALNLQAQMKTREMVSAKIVTALFGVAVNFVGAYWYGIVGIIGAGLIFALSYFIWMAVLVSSGSKKECFC